METINQEKDWLGLKEQYLKQIEEALAESGQPNIESIIEDIRGHLDRRFSELSPPQRSWGNYQAIITEMGPPSEYAELAGQKKDVPAKKISLGFVFILAVVLSLLTFGLTMLPILLPKNHIPNEADKIQSVLIDEPELTGKWVSVDFVKDPNEFNPGEKQWLGDLFLKNMVFYSDGTTSLGWFWTKGWVIENEIDVRAEYEIRDINETMYLFLPWLGGDVKIQHQKPGYYILKKVSEKPSQEQAVAAAVESAELWLKLIDQGQYEQSWIESAEYFRRNVGEKQWLKAIDGVRKPLGKVLSRKVLNTTYTTTLPGAPDGQYVVIQFETSFENKQNAVETITPMLEPNGQWRVSGYYIR